MQSPFNFPIQLLTDQELVAAAAEAEGVELDAATEPETPALLTVLQARASASRRGGTKVTLGFMLGELPVPLTQIRLEQN